MIEEHLTDSLPDAGYRVGEHFGRLMDGWNFPADWSGPSLDGNFVVKVQPFAKGGYELSLRSLDLGKIGRVMEFGAARGKRERPEELSVDSLIKSGQRAKRKVRYLCRNMMASHLLTLTRRESDESEFWTLDQWQEAWDRLRRLLVRLIGQFPYVAIPERHKKGNYHLHVAWVGHINVRLVRRMWQSVGGSNIDAKRFNVQPGHDRSSRIARYISKYVSKSFDDAACGVDRFNRKRYWASKQTLEDARRYVLRSLTLAGAVEELRVLLGLDFSRFVDDRGQERNLYRFPDGSGIWLSYLPELHDPAPPF